MAKTSGSVLEPQELAIKRCLCLSARAFYLAGGSTPTSPLECVECAMLGKYADRPCEICGATNWTPRDDGKV